MSQHYRTIRDTEEGFVDVHQDSVTDRLFIDGVIDLDHGYKVAAAIIEMYRFRGVPVDEQLSMIRSQIAEWDANDECS